MQEQDLSTTQSAAQARPGLALGRERGGLRDACWMPAGPDAETGPQPGRTQRLHHWALSPGQRVAGLLFQPLDGNPRHGVLSLFVDQGEWYGAIEIVERQARWLVMPEDLRARTLAVAALARAGGQRLPHFGIAATPDRRFIFFNSPNAEGTTTWVERHRELGTFIS